VPGKNLPEVMELLDAEDFEDDRLAG